MNKDQLILLVLKQLIERTKDSPECFDIECDEVSNVKTHNGTTILWRPRCDLGDENIISDPLNLPNVIIIRDNKPFNRLDCHIFLKGLSTTSAFSGLQADASIEIEYSFPRMFYRTFRKFQKLKKILINRHKNKQNDKFLKKLMSVFPSSLDDKLLK